MNAINTNARLARLAYLQFCRFNEWAMCAAADANITMDGWAALEDEASEWYARSVEYKQRYFDACRDEGANPRHEDIEVYGVLEADVRKAANSEWETLREGLYH